MRLRKRKWMEELIQKRNDIFFEESELSEALIFDNTKRLIIEIGSGKGGFLKQMAINNPDEQYLGIEMQRSALAIALKYIEENSIPNLKFVCIDASKVFENLKDESVDCIFLNFSDPWPKKKQHKRRLTYPTFLKEYYRILKPNGLLIFKTDNENLFNDSLKYVNDSEFELISTAYDYKGDDDYDAQTEYETKFRNQGIKICRLIAKKGN